MGDADKHGRTRMSLLGHGLTRMARMARILFFHLRVGSINRVGVSLARSSIAEAAEQAEKTKGSLRAP